MRNKKEDNLKTLIDKMLGSYGLTEKLDEVSIKKGWENIVGKMVANHTTKIYIRGKILYVQLDSASLKQELSYAKSKIIERINLEFGKQLVNDMVIR